MPTPSHVLVGLTETINNRLYHAVRYKENPFLGGSQIF